MNKSDYKHHRTPLEQIQTWWRMKRYLGQIRSYAIDNKLKPQEIMRFWHEQQRVETFILRIEKQIMIEFVEVDMGEEWGGQTGY